MIFSYPKNFPNRLEDFSLFKKRNSKAYMRKLIVADLNVFIYIFVNLLEFEWTSHSKARWKSRKRKIFEFLVSVLMLFCVEGIVVLY